MIVDLVPVWTVILAVGVLLYVVLDGADLGVGILHGFAPDEPSRGLVMNSIAPIWDGNETWLVLGGAGLLAAFPLAFAIIIPAVYIPILVMLLALIFRGVAFEFRYRRDAGRTFWEHGFTIGSTVATLAQGMVLGAFIQGFKVEGRTFAGTSWDWLTPFSVFVGIALVFGYSLLGAGWLILKTEGDLQRWARRWARPALIGVTVAILVVSVWTALAFPHVAARWFAWPGMLAFAPVPVLSALAFWYVWRSIEDGPEPAVYLGGLVLFFLAYTGIAISLWPMIVPYHYTLWEAASSPATQVFLAVGTLFLLPIILVYTAWSYWVFRGKVRGDFGYH
ncbi:MAG: cytochrome d ubiquinol oxidase subunit II [Geminicoccaceae bacterium]